MASVVLLTAASVRAHSLLLGSSPTAGAVVTAAPNRITLSFNNRIEKPLSAIRLLDASGRPHALTVLVADGPADTLTATAPPLEPGPYRVEWQVLSTDGHVVTGSFSFRVQN